MPRTTRRALLDKAERGIRLCDELDLVLMDMDLLARGRQPEIDKRKAIMVHGHEALRELWKDLKSVL